jgi:hypothetical protein
METIVMAKPIDVCRAKAPPITSGGQAAADKAEN